MKTQLWHSILVMINGTVLSNKISRILTKKKELLKKTQGKIIWKFMRNKRNKWMKKEIERPSKNKVNWNISKKLVQKQVMCFMWIKIRDQKHKKLSKENQMQLPFNWGKNITNMLMIQEREWPHKQRREENNKKNSLKRID